MVYIEQVAAKFRKIGSDIRFVDKTARGARQQRRDFGRRSSDAPQFSIDIVNDGSGEVFLLDTFDSENLDISVLDLQRDKRHLLLMIKDLTPEQDRDKLKSRIVKYLCGHDERHWFVAAVPEAARAKNVEDAILALKPNLAKESQIKARVKRKNKDRRKNKGYLRQGEWFFVPAPGIDPGDSPIHRNEPLSRGAGSKPHICQELFRMGGVLVYVSNKFAPAGLTQEEFERYSREHPNHVNGRYRWDKMVKDPEAYARGYVRHPDHKSIYLNGWHRVLPNQEDKAWAMKRMVFLD